jgi:DMSO/TMAO reductase YedYZ molybdopterin-dependent catalytic subunit
MRVNRRTFLKLAPLGVAVSAVSLWVLKEKTQITSSGTAERVSSSESTPTETYDFPETWAEHVDHPIVDRKDYLLKIDGDVSKPLQLTLEELYAMPSVNQSSTITCVEGWSALVPWEGIPLIRLLTQAGAPSKFSHVTVESITGYTTKITQDDAADPRTIIALKAGSAPLNDEHGYPTRLVLPKKAGLEWIKQVSRITCTMADTQT